MKNFIRITTFLLAVLLLGVSFARAQILPDFGNIINAGEGADLKLSINPQVALAKSQIIAFADTSGINMDRATFGWYLDGEFQEQASGRNKSTFVFQSGKAGLTHSIRLVIKNGANDLFETRASIPVKDLIMDWQAHTSVPYFYQGRPLPTEKSQVTVTGVPVMDTPLGALNFRWFLDDNLDAQKSGIGRSSFSFRAKKRAGGEHEVRLEITNTDSNETISKTIDVPVVSPEVGFYLRSGPASQSAIRETITMPPGGKADIGAIPFYFNTKKPSDLEFEWFFEGETIKSEGRAPDVLELTAPPDTPAGSVFSISLKVSDPKDELSFTVKELEVLIR